VVLLLSLRLPQQVDPVHGRAHAYARGDMPGSGRGARFASPAYQQIRLCGGFGSRVWENRAAQRRRRRPAGGEIEKCTDLPHGKEE
jgi:hypothetical protein